MTPLLHAALDHHRAGRWSDAVKLYREALAQEPGNFEVHYNLGVALTELGATADAEQSFRAAARLNPGFAPAHNNLGIILARARRLPEALQSYDHALSCSPGYVEAHNNRAGVLAELGQYAESEAGYRRALHLKPDYVEAYYNFGILLKETGRLLEAVQSYERALSLRPNYAEAHNNLGVALRSLGRLDEAMAHFQHALQLRPGYIEAISNIGGVFEELRELGQAEKWFRHALRLKPDYVNAQNSLGNVLRGLGRLDESVEAYRRALLVDPGYAQAHHNLAVLLADQGDMLGALQGYREALALKPDYAQARIKYVHQAQHACDWRDFESHVEGVRRAVAAAREPLSPFAFMTLPGTTAREQYACARQYGEHMYPHFLSRPPMHAQRRFMTGPRLRVGYLSADFHEHATSYLLAGIIELHDRGHFDVYAYSYGADEPSAMRARMRAAFDCFRDIRTLSYEAAARQISDDAIDILVDLKGYTREARIQIGALRPSPVLVNWLGYPGTLGHERLADYIIGDAMVTPLEHAGHYSEKLALLPDCYQPNDRRRALPAAPSRREAGLPESAFVFACFNQAYKLTPAMFDVWCALLRDIPGSLLWLLEPTPLAQDNLRREAVQRNVPAERIVFAPRRAQSDHLARLQLVDLALDTFPYTSHTTASDALWAGIPLVTLIGDTFVSRVAASVLAAAGIPELITRSPDAYQVLASALARQPQRLQDLRSRISAARKTCPLFDSARFTRNLERLYQRVASDHRAGRLEHIVLKG